MIKFILTVLTLVFLSCNPQKEAIESIELSIIDSDGDGISDVQELELFSPNVDNRKFNPLISDLPILKIQIQDIPSIEINYIQESSSSFSYSTGFSRDIEISTEVSGSATAGTKVSAGYDGGFVAKGEISASVTLSASVSQSITNSLQSSIERASSNSLTATEAKISVPVFISNIGNMPSKLTDLILTAYTINSSGRIEMIGSLRADGGFDEIYLLPNTEPVIMNFTNEGLYPYTIMSIIHRAREIVVVPSSYNLDLLLSDVTINYHEAYSRVQLNTARINIMNTDNIEAYNVAINSGDSLKDLLDILQLEYVFSDGWFTQINRERGHNVFSNGEWILEHSGKRNGLSFYNKYTSQRKINKEDLFLERGDLLVLRKEIVEQTYSPGEEGYRWTRTQPVTSSGSTYRYKYLYELMYSPSILRVLQEETKPQPQSYESTDRRSLPEINYEAERQDSLSIDRYIINIEHSMIRDRQERLQKLFTNIDLALEPTKTFRFAFGDANRAGKQIFVNGVDVSENFDLRNGREIFIDIEELNINHDLIYSIEFFFYDVLDPNSVLYYPMIANNTRWEHFNQYQVYNFTGR